MKQGVCTKIVLCDVPAFVPTLRKSGMMIGWLPLIESDKQIF